MKGNLILTVEEAEKDRDKWLQVRKEGLGGSDVAAIIGVNSYRSAYNLWAIKTGREQEDDLTDNEFVYWGTKNEPNIADHFEEVTGKKVRRCGTLQDEKVPFFHANIDRWVIGENAGLEIKTAGLTKSKEWQDDDLPDDYYCQCQWYMGITDAEKWYIACLIGGNKMVWKEIPRNDEFIATLRERALDFWNNNILGDVMPDVDGSESTSDSIKKQYPNSNGGEIALPSAMQSLLDEYDQIKATAKALELRQAAIENQIKALMGENEIGIYQDRKVTWKSQAGRVSVDSKKLLAEFPAAYLACSKTGKPYRVFKIK